jgi:hypothetical protein
VNLGLVFFMENPLYRSKLYFSGRNLTEFCQRKKRKRKSILTLKAPKKQPSNVCTHTQNIFYFIFMKILKNKENPQRKEKKRPTYPKICTKILPRPPGFRMYAQRRGEEEDGWVDPGASSSSRSLF